jgi:guanylate kinase
VRGAQVHGNFYGTSKAAVEAVTTAGRVCVLDIDVKGAKQVKAAGVPAKLIFVSPPSLAVLEKRLKERGTESAENVAVRMRNASEEMEAVFYPGFFDRVLLNTELAATYTTFREVRSLNNKGEGH